MADPEVWIGCDLHDAEGLALNRDEVTPMKRLAGVKSVQIEIDREPPKIPVQGLRDASFSFSSEFRLTQAGREFFADL